VILEKEWFLDAILLKFTELDNQANGAGQRLFNDEIFLSSDLLPWSELLRGLKTRPLAPTDSSRRSSSRLALSAISRVLTAFAAEFAAITF
jgi:hypothetical protein